tara:strand:- start:1042 stop:1767 length:726 start_codon:yes stop_codon:yes gene_type:complete
MDESLKLNNNWYSDGWIDFELKKYKLLAYLQKADDFFKQSKLYPVLSELIQHYNHLNNYQKNQEQLISKLKKEIKSIDLKKMKIIFKKHHFSDQFIDELMKIIHFAQKEIKKSIQHGEETYHHLSSNISFDTVGLIPFYNKEGYLIISRNSDQTLKVYRYNYSYIQQENDLFHNLKTNEIHHDFSTLSSSLTSVKLKLIKKYKDLPNPATYSLHSQLNISFEHSILPIGKRWLLKEIISTA